MEIFDFKPAENMIYCIAYFMCIILFDMWLWYSDLLRGGDQIRALCQLLQDHQQIGPRKLRDCVSRVRPNRQHGGRFEDY
jgi:hypothetical protein